MPKLIDRSERLEQIHRAALRLIIDKGLVAASLRNVAAESGLNIGSVRHYVGSHDELLRGAARAMGDRVQERIRARYQRLGPAATGTNWFEAAVAMFEELLPLDAERRAEAAVWLAFQEYGRVDAEIAEIAAEMTAGIRESVAALLSAGGSDDPAAVDAVSALLDGLAMHGTSSVTDHGYAERARRALRWQLTAVWAVSGRRCRPAEE